jgi:hypothetical protein
MIPGITRPDHYLQQNLIGNSLCKYKGVLTISSISPMQTIVSRGAKESGVSVVGFGRSHGNYIRRVTKIVPRHFIKNRISPVQTIVSCGAKEPAVRRSHTNYIIGRVTNIVPRRITTNTGPNSFSPLQTIVSRGAKEFGVVGRWVVEGCSHGNYIGLVTNIFPMHIRKYSVSPVQTIVLVAQKSLPQIEAMATT